MRVKINGRDIDRNDRVTFEASNYSDSQAYTVILVGVAFIYMIAKGGLFS
ncbi:hypothetical protein PAECIP111891_04242 [Paenibacillus allorhizoplanae]|uniref:Uncharacterized protein n=1 Tax=Paenibacillus allorhizoplanae TaxID=2905648 RepID=A0ABM9CK72_9BACL|nr:hypothetical protein [Paenibacillus allorhizoplanae]CAH1215265.1 hypothetical protein PAECIP111891_04242 [Paenibacillus allorhizoplanae]